MRPYLIYRSADVKKLMRFSCGAYQLAPQTTEVQIRETPSA